MPSPPATTSSKTLPLVRDAQAHLRSRRLGHPMEGHATLGSTNERALAWARAGAPEGSTVVTDHQTSGRGRHGRRWESQAAQNLTFSVVLRPAGSTAHAPLPPGCLGLLALAGGLAVCQAIADVVPPPAPRLKWPNDVLLQGEKCCGLLLETSSAGAALGPVVLGVGINVNQCTFPRLPPGRPPPASLALATGRPVARAPLLAQVLEHLDARYFSLFDDDGPAAVRQACEQRLTALGQHVTVQFPSSGKLLDGTFLGLAPDGAMRLQTAGGERTLHAGDVTTK